MTKANSLKKTNCTWTFHRLSHNGIDEELFKVVSGFDPLTEP